MVKINYSEIDEIYREIKSAACGRQACSVVIMVANEVDAVASARMLTQLLRNDSVAYSIIPVANFTQVMNCYKACVTKDIKSIFLINCGAIYNIPKLFELEQGGQVRCFIMDNHRPIHLANIHSRHNVVVFDDSSKDDPLSNYIEYPSDKSSDVSLDELDDQSLESSSDDDNDNEADDNDFSEDEDEQDGEFEEDDKDKEIGGEDNDNDDNNKDPEDPEAEDDADNEEDDSEGEDSEDKKARADVAEQADLPGSGTTQAADEEVQDKVVGEASLVDDTGAASHGDAAAEVDTEAGAEAGAGAGAAGEADEDEEDEEDEVDKPAGAEDEYEAGDQAGAEEDNEESGQEQNQAENQEDTQVDDEDIQVVGRRRRDLEDRYDPVKRRRLALRRYYNRNQQHVKSTAFSTLSLVFGRTGSHVTLDMMWQAILGVTDQQLRGRLTDEQYAQDCSQLRYYLAEHLLSASERGRHIVHASGAGVQAQLDTPAGAGPPPQGQAQTQEDLDVAVPACEAGNIDEGDDYRFFMHRHWSLYDSMCYSPYVAAKLLVWQESGTTKLNELLARMGVPLSQCKQAFNFMAPSHRDHFKKMISSNIPQDEFNMSNPGVMSRSFFRFTSFRNQVAAADVVCAGQALLEMCNSNSDSWTTDSPGSGQGQTQVGSRLLAFNEAHDCLGMQDNVLKKGIAAAIKLQKSIMHLATVLLQGTSIVRLSRLMYVDVRAEGHQQSAASSGQLGGGAAGAGGRKSLSGAVVGAEGAQEVDQPFTRPQVLTRLGQLILNIKMNMTARQDGWSGRSVLPLLLLAERGDNYLIVGISPLLPGNLIPPHNQISAAHQEKLNILTNFRAYFKLAAQDNPTAVLKNDAFDGNVAEISKDHVFDFIGDLNAILKHATPSPR